MVQPLWKTIKQLPKKLKEELPYDPIVLPVHIYPKDVKARFQRYLNTHVHSSQKVEAAECPSIVCYLHKM